MIAFLGEKDKGSSVPLESPICLIAPSRNEHICRSAKFNPFCWRSPSALDFCQKTKPDHGKLLFICLQSVTLLGRGHDPPVDIRPLADVRLSRTMAQVCPSMLQGTNSGGGLIPLCYVVDLSGLDIALPVVLPQAAPQEAPPERPALLSCPEALSGPEPTEPSDPPSSQRTTRTQRASRKQAGLSL